MFRKNIAPKKLMKLENTMKNEGVGGVGSGGVTGGGSGKGDNSASNADVGAASTGGMFDNCIVM